MPTVVNDLILEPKASPPGDEAKTAGVSEGSAPPPPEMERQVKRVERLCRERGLRLWAH